MIMLEGAKATTETVNALRTKAAAIRALPYNSTYFFQPESLFDYLLVLLF